MDVFLMGNPTKRDDTGYPYFRKSQIVVEHSLAVPGPTSFPSLMAFSLRFSLGAYEDPTISIWC